MRGKNKNKKSGTLLFTTLTLVDPYVTFLKKLARSTKFTIIVLFLF